MALRSIASLFVATAFAFAPQTPLINPDDASHGPNEASARASAPHVFNALHSAMRQWGSSLNHNGMSFFPAVIPANTDFYHGRHTSERVTGTEWLAFEIEHAEVFARNRRGGPGGGRGPPGAPPGESPGDGHKPDTSGQGDDESTAALHHYRTFRELNVLFLDGMSAGKTSMGTLDQQDYVLCNGTVEKFLMHTDAMAGPPGDAQRAAQMCTDFGHAIDGIVRMEAGFELILCNFSTGVDFISATPRPAADSPESFNILQPFEYLRGLSMRYHGITAGRVRVDYSNMVSAYFYNVNLTNPDPEHASLPRLVSADPETMIRIKSEVTSALSAEDVKSTIDWQGIVDLIVTRYSDRLQFIAGAATSHDAIVSEINFLLSMYIDYSSKSPDIPVAIEKCTTHYLEPYTLRTRSDRLIYTALSTVAHEICRSLFKVRQLVLSSNATAVDEQAKTAIIELTKYLSWTTWLDCGKCAYDEVCFVAVWPYGGVREHEAPGCVRSDEVASRRGYWNFPGRGGPGSGGPGRRPPPSD